MQFQVKTGAASQQRTACAIVPVFSGGELPSAARSLDKAGGGLITRAIRNRDIKGEVGDVLLLTHTGDLPCQRILLVGLGPKAKLDRRAWRKAVRSALATVARGKYGDAILHLTTEPVSDADAYRRARLAVEIWHDVSYRFTAMKSEPGDTAPALKELGIAASGRDVRSARRGHRARRGHCARRGPGQGPGQPPAQRLHAQLPGGTGARHREARQEAHRQGSRPGRDPQVAHGRLPGRHPGLRGTAPLHRAPVPGRTRPGHNPSCSSARASPSIRAASPSSRPARWTR